MQAILTSLDRRWRRSDAGLAPCHWKICLFLTANVVLLSAFLFDWPVGATLKSLSPSIHFFGEMLTNFGESGWILIISAFLFFEGWAGARLLHSPRCRCQALRICQIGGYLLTTIALSGILANLLKRAIGRARPTHFADWGPFGFSPFNGRASFESFPSGHATTIGALFVALAFLFPRYRYIFAACALWLAITRVMVGAHYPSDVIAGLALGGWFSFMTAIVYSRYGLLFRINDAGLPTPRRTLFKISKQDQAAA
ncbi:phosphatase PAP2 family protein [Rhizobium sp. P38BS-XIX]|uniref:lipid A 1-phosphatase LpxE n=1 Tax=Rhizobium sp. P38BS-XIX TaxID=2726740 RepID=UPI0014572EDE|nr:lipid A 1-phosphatase LpxE [Rhizobium sp. P38BS-XIX]NLS01169.1 phosphatase PAP2 family protein [Rhizobium sp. P38BS-XIX]